MAKTREEAMMEGDRELAEARGWVRPSEAKAEQAEARAAAAEARAYANEGRSREETKKEGAWGKWGTCGWGVTEGKAATGDQSRMVVVKGVKGDDAETGVWRKRAEQAEGRLQAIAEERETERAEVERKAGR